MGRHSFHENQNKQLKFQLLTFSFINMTHLKHLHFINPQMNALITDYKYSSYGNLLATSNSQGLISIFKINKKKYEKIVQFKADDGAIWSIGWGNPKYGNVLGVGTFRKKVLIFQEIKNQWKQVAFHELHQGSVNCVEWSPVGFKLFAGSSDGKISVLQLVNGKKWNSFIFQVSEEAVTSISLMPLSLSEEFCENQETFYPKLATISKDKKLRIWEYQIIKQNSEIAQLFRDESEDTYSLMKEHKVEKQSIRSLLWRPSWQTLINSLKSISLVTASEEGFLKILQFSKNQKGQYCQPTEIQIYSSESFPILKISQTLTGNVISVSINTIQKSQVLVFQEEDYRKWKFIQ